jgi:hypothetical protein
MKYDDNDMIRFRNEHSYMNDMNNDDVSNSIIFASFILNCRFRDFILSIIEVFYKGFKR